MFGASQPSSHQSKIGSAPTPPSFAQLDHTPSLHSVPQRESISEGNSVRNRDKSAGIFTGLNGGNFSAEPTKPRAFHLTQREWRQLSSEAFRAFAGNRPSAHKAIAEVVECSPKTAQSWLDAESTPAGILDLRAMARIPEYAALKREIAAMETDMDPRLQAKIQELHRMSLRIAGEL